MAVMMDSHFRDSEGEGAKPTANGLEVHQHVNVREREISYWGSSCSVETRSVLSDQVNNICRSIHVPHWLLALGPSIAI